MHHDYAQLHNKPRRPMAVPAYQIIPENRFEEWAIRRRFLIAKVIGTGILVMLAIGLLGRLAGG